MQLNSTLLKAYEAQITLELEASVVYRQLAIEMDIRDLPGMATWLRYQADEEIGHANRLINHVTARSGNPQIGAIKAPDVKVDSVKSCFEAALAHEQRVSEAVRSLYRTTEEAGDLDSRPLLNWFLEEQIEEESTVSEIVTHLELVADDGDGLLRLDADLGSRPAASTEPTAN